MNNPAPAFRYYQVLQIDPPCSWEQLKQQYRKLANTWHPDRLQDHPEMLAVADDRLKEINLAYSYFSAYFKEHGSLPEIEVIERAEIDDFIIVEPDEPVVSPETTAYERPSGESNAGQRRGYRRAVTLGLLLMIGYFSFRYIQSTDSDYESLRVTESLQSEKDSIEHRYEIDRQPVPKHQKYFSYGSTLGQVHAAQGIPTRTNGDIWYYGDSEVYFKNGRVVNWRNTAEHPLNILRDALNINKSNFFVIGSSKERVRLVQGKPTNESADTWDYGLSRVYFSNGVVVDWHNSPLNPLKARK